jgi:hypothetical protein
LTAAEEAEHKFRAWSFNGNIDRRTTMSNVIDIKEKREEKEPTKCPCGWPIPVNVNVDVESDKGEALSALNLVITFDCPRCAKRLQLGKSKAV